MPMTASWVAATCSRGKSPAPADPFDDARAGDAEGCLERGARDIREPSGDSGHDVDG